MKLSEHDRQAINGDGLTYHEWGDPIQAHLIDHRGFSLGDVEDVINTWDLFQLGTSIEGVEAELKALGWIEDGDQ
jgi:hypothetical protein